jgi:hypothetical protein
MINPSALAVYNIYGVPAVVVVLAVVDVLTVVDIEDPSLEYPNFK